MTLTMKPEACRPCMLETGSRPSATTSSRHYSKGAGLRAAFVGGGDCSSCNRLRPRTLQAHCCRARCSLRPALAVALATETWLKDQGGSWTERDMILGTMANLETTVGFEGKSDVY